MRCTVDWRENGRKISKQRLRQFSPVRDQSRQTPEILAGQDFHSQLLILGMLLGSCPGGAGVRFRRTHLPHSAEAVPYCLELALRPPTVCLPHLTGRDRPANTAAPLEISQRRAAEGRKTRTVAIVGRAIRQSLPSLPILCCFRIIQRRTITNRPASLRRTVSATRPFEARLCIMTSHSWLGSLLSASRFGEKRRASSGRAQPSARLSVEQLEDRCVLTAGFLSPAVLPTPPVYLSSALALDFAPRGNPQVVFMGDSISAWYANSPAWASRIGPLGARDLAVPASTTGNVLWQLDTGVLNGTSPKAIVLMIGINNLLQGQTPEDTAQGIAACVTALRLRQPQAQILLLGILPAEQTPDLPIRQDITLTNALIAGLDDGVSVHFLDVGASFLKPTAPSRLRCCSTTSSTRRRRATRPSPMPSCSLCRRCFPAPAP